MNDSLSPVQLAAIRGLILETVQAGGFAGATERMCADAVSAAYPSESGFACLQLVRTELDYLESAGMLALKRSGALLWTAKLTKQGRDVAESMADAPDGILPGAMTTDLSPLQVASVRWLILQIVQAGGIVAATERMCADAVSAAYPGAGAERVRTELDYLESAGLIELNRPGVLPWTAKLTKQGRDVADYVADAPDGILRPRER